MNSVHQDLAGSLEPLRAHCQALLRISLAIHARLDLAELLEQVVYYARALTQCEDASVVLWNPYKRVFEEGTSTNLGDSVARRVRREGGASRWIFDNGQPLVVADTRRDSFVANPMISEGGIRAYAGVPVQQGGDTMGILYALAHQLRKFDEGELEIMQALADMAAIAIRNARLVRSLRELNEFKGTMIRMAAHDLQNPLALARGYFGFLIEDLEPFSPEHTRWVDTIRRSLAQMNDLIDGILAYGQLTSTDEMQRQPCDLNAIARRVVAEFEPAATQKSHHLGLEAASEPLVVLGEELLLREMVGNLVANAIKYTPPGGQITVRTHGGQEEHTVVVQDTGPGIDPADQDKLFQPFVRLRSTGEERGSGLGLCLVQTIVERHGGRVSVESSQGEGAAFSVYLPAASSE